MGGVGVERRSRLGEKMDGAGTHGSQLHILIVHGLMGWGGMGGGMGTDNKSAHSRLGSRHMLCAHTCMCSLAWGWWWGGSGDGL